VKSQTFLLVEDSRDDAFFMRYALERAGVPHSLQVVGDAEQAIDYLKGTGNYSDRDAFPIPTIIFLDLKLPGLSGFDVLAWARGPGGFRDLPIFILTGSSEERDRKKAVELGAQGYLVKPPREAMLQEAIASLRPRIVPAAACQASESPTGGGGGRIPRSAEAEHN